MKHFLLLLTLLVSAFSGQAQKMQFGRLAFEIPNGFRVEKGKQELYIYNLQKQLCAVVYSNYVNAGNLEETQWQLWNQEIKFPNYTIGEMMNRYTLESGGAKGIRADYETRTDNGMVSKSAIVYESAGSCDAVLTYCSDIETKYALDAFLKSIVFVAPQAAVSLSALERSYQWYRALRGPDISNSSIQVYQSQTSINFTGFMAASQQHLQRLGDSLFYLRELPNLQMILIGQTRMDDAAAMNIGLLRSIKQVQTVSQGFGLPITNTGLQGLSNAVTLEILDLQGIDINGVTDAGLAHLAKLTNLRKLFFSRASRITIAGFEQLTPLKQLQELNLSFCILTDADLPRLRAVIQQLPALRILYIQSTAMTPEATLQLRQEFPHITIYR
jgi:hypothetical protein